MRHGEKEAVGALQVALDPFWRTQTICGRPRPAAQQPAIAHPPRQTVTGRSAFLMKHDEIAPPVKGGYNQAGVGAEKGHDQNFRLMPM